MRRADYDYLKSEIEKAETNLRFYEKLEKEPQKVYTDYSKDIYFWKGYLNAVNLAWLQSKNNYKLV